MERCDYIENDKIHPELRVAGIEKLDPILELQKMLTITTQMIDIKSGDWYSIAANVYSNTTQYLTSIQSDIIELANKTFQKMLFHKIINILEKHFYYEIEGYPYGAKTTWKLMEISDDCTQATYILSKYWQYYSDYKGQRAPDQYRRFSILNNPGDGTAIISVDYLTKDNTIIKSIKTRVNKSQSLEEWVATYF